MNSTSSFTPSEIERYRRLRALSRELNHRILRTVPREAMLETAKAIGVEHDGQLWLDGEDVMSVLMDCCLYDWIDGGRSLVQRYAEAQVREAGTDEDFLLQAYLKAQYRIVRPQAVLPGAGVSVRDELSGEQLVIMDVGLSESGLDDRMHFATRTIPLETYSMTGGAALPMDAKAKETALRRLTEERLLVDGVVTDPHKTALSVVRACLESGLARHVRYDDLEAPQPQRSSCQLRRAPRAPGRNEQCPCGSDKKYKKCCGAR